MSETIDVGPVHVLDAPGGACVSDCPHPDHAPIDVRAGAVSDLCEHKRGMGLPGDGGDR